MMIQVVAQKVLPSGLILPTVISIRGDKIPIQQFMGAVHGDSGQKPYMAIRYRVAIKGKEVILVPGYAGYWQLWDASDERPNTIQAHPQSISPQTARLPYRSRKKTYRIWHTHASEIRKTDSRFCEVIEAYTGNEAKKLVKSMYPDHLVGNPILVNK